MDHNFANVICALMSIAGAAMTVVNLRRGIRSTQQATGTVMTIERSEDTDGVSFRPIVQFSHHGESIVLDQLFGWGWPPRLQPSDSVTVHFPPGEPKAARLSRWAWPEIMIPGIVGTIGTAMWIWIAAGGK